MTVRRRVFLHIGAPKTGTTYLQDRLARNARSLAGHGVHFPAARPFADPTLAQFRAALDLLDQDWGGPPGHAHGAWDALVRRVNRLSGTVVISHEILAPALPEHVARARADLDVPGVSELHVVYSARDQGRQVPAAWQESIKQGRSWPYRRYLRRIRGTDRGGGRRRSPWFARAFDLPTVLENWTAEMAPERVHVVTVPHGEGRSDDTLWLRFCRVFDVDPAWAPAEAVHHNTSLGVAETQLLRKLNQRMERAGRVEAPHDELLREMLAEDRLLTRRGVPLRMPPRLHDWAVAEAERWAAWIAERGVRVEGDVAELRPAAPTAAADYVDPDRVPRRQQLDVALDALAAMTREAARRPDPARTVAARVRTRIDRVRDS